MAGLGSVGSCPLRAPRGCNGTGPGPGTAPSPACLRALSRRPALRAPLPGPEFTSTLPLGLPRPHPGLGAAPEPHSPPAGVEAHAHAHTRALIHVLANKRRRVGPGGQAPRPRGRPGCWRRPRGWYRLAGGLCRSVGPLGKTSQSCYPHAHCHHRFGVTTGAQCQRGSYRRPREGDSRRTLLGGPTARSASAPSSAGLPLLILAFAFGSFVSNGQYIHRIPKNQDDFKRYLQESSIAAEKPPQTLRLPEPGSVGPSPGGTGRLSRPPWVSQAKPRRPRPGGPGEEQRVRSRSAAGRESTPDFQLEEVLG